MSEKNPFQVDVLFPGFAGKLTNGGLGWGTVAIIRHGKRVFLMDTGGPVIRGTLPGMLAEKGVKPQDVEMVLLTHLHFDHAYNVDMFPEAVFVFSAQEWEYANNVKQPDCFAAENALPLLRHLKKKLIDSDNEEIIPGVNAIFTPGHTPGSTSFILHQNKEIWLFSGDAAKNRGELRNREVQMTLDFEQSKKSIERIVSIADRVLPGHDGWVSVREKEIIAEGGNDVTLIFGEGITVNGGHTHITLHLD